MKYLLSIANDLNARKKAIVLKKYGIPAIGLWGIYAVKEDWIPWMIKRFERRYLVYDADNWAVLQSANKQADRLQALPVFPPGKPDDLLTSGAMTPGQFTAMLRSSHRG